MANEIKRTVGRTATNTRSTGFAPRRVDRDAVKPARSTAGTVPTRPSVNPKGDIYSWNNAGGQDWQNWRWENSSGDSSKPGMASFVYNGGMTSEVTKLLSTINGAYAKVVSPTSKAIKITVPNSTLSRVKTTLKVR